MHIGFIGGIGPAATVAYYDRTVRAFQDANLKLNLTIDHADVGVLVKNAQAEARREQAEVFAKHLNQLHAAGCDVAAITALTGHFCFDELAQISPLPLISAISPIDRFCVNNGVTTVGILGSPPVMASHLFGQLQETKSVIPSSETEKLGQTYFEMAIKGVCSEEARAAFFAAGAEMVSKQSADAVLLAGTDLGLAFDGHDPGFPIIDALDIHVDEFVSTAL